MNMVARHTILAVFTGVLPHGYPGVSHSLVLLIASLQWSLYVPLSFVFFCKLVV